MGMWALTGGSAGDEGAGSIRWVCGPLQGAVQVVKELGFMGLYKVGMWALTGGSAGAEGAGLHGAL